MDTSTDGKPLKKGFPEGLRVLAVDDDPLCLRLVKTMLSRCAYEVTTCSHAAEALGLLRSDAVFDLVLSDVHMPDMDGFKLLQTIGSETDLPVIMMSTDGDVRVVLQGITHGAEDYLIKPIRLEELRNLWQHVVRRKRGMLPGGPGQGLGPGSNKRLLDEDQQMRDPQRRRPDDTARPEPADDELKEGAEEREGTEEAGEGGAASSAPKKPRVLWSVELHQQFVNAVTLLGVDKAVPKRILDLMGVEGLTRENVASHLQKYRLYLKRLSSAQGGLSGLTATMPGLVGGSSGLPAGLQKMERQVPALDGRHQVRGVQPALFGLGDPMQVDPALAQGVGVVTGRAPGAQGPVQMSFGHLDAGHDHGQAGAVGASEPSKLVVNLDLSHLPQSMMEAPNRGMMVGQQPIRVQVPNQNQGLSLQPFMLEEATQLPHVNNMNLLNFFLQDIPN